MEIPIYIFLKRHPNCFDTTNAPLSVDKGAFLYEWIRENAERLRFFGRNVTVDVCTRQGFKSGQFRGKNVTCKEHPLTCAVLDARIVSGFLWELLKQEAHFLW